MTNEGRSGLVRFRVTSYLFSMDVMDILGRTHNHILKVSCQYLYFWLSYEHILSKGLTSEIIERFERSNIKTQPAQIAMVKEWSWGRPEQFNY